MNIYCVSWYDANAKIWHLVQHTYPTLVEADQAAKGLKNSFNCPTQILCKLNHFPQLNQEQS